MYKDQRHIIDLLFPMSNKGYIMGEQQEKNNGIPVSAKIDLALNQKSDCNKQKEQVDLGGYDKP